MEAAIATDNADAGGIPSSAAYSQMQADIRGRIIFQSDIAVTAHTQDIVLWSTSARRVVRADRTVGKELERRKLKYKDLVVECRDNDCSVCLQVAVGCWGFARHSLWKTLRMVGITGLVKDHYNNRKVGPTMVNADMELGEIEGNLDCK